MTVNGWIQIALYCAIIIAITKPLGGYMTRVFNGEKTFLSPVLRPIERVFYAICGVDEKEDQHWVIYARRHAGLQHGRLLSSLSRSAPAGRSAVQSAEVPGRRRASRLQHLGQLHHQHELAVLRARNDDELSGADGRADGAQLSSPPRPASRWPSRWCAASPAVRRRASAISGSI